jgi:hypothetical protein
MQISQEGTWHSDTLRTFLQERKIEKKYMSYSAIWLAEQWRNVISDGLRFKISRAPLVEVPKARFDAKGTI